MAGDPRETLTRVILWAMVAIGVTLIGTAAARAESPVATRSGGDGEARPTPARFVAAPASAAGAARVVPHAAPAPAPAPARARPADGGTVRARRELSPAWPRRASPAMPASASRAAYLRKLEAAYSQRWNPPWW